MGLGAHPPPKFLLLGKNPCVIRAKHKNFGKIMLCPDNFLYVCESYGVWGKTDLVCPENVLYVSEKYGKLGEIFGYVWEKFFGDLPPARQKFWGEILISDGPANLYCAPPNKIRPIRP